MVVSSYIENIYKALAKMRIYNLKGEMIGGELAAYDKGFRYIEEKLKSLWNLPFPVLCDKADLENYRRLLKIKNSDNATDEAIREMVKTRMTVTNKDFTLEGITRALKSVGLDCVVFEDNKNGKIKVTAKGFLDGNLGYDVIREEIGKIAPAHLEFEFDIGLLTWNMFEEKDLSFSELDGNNFTCEEIDLKGHLLKKGNVLNGK